MRAPRKLWEVNDVSQRTGQSAAAVKQHADKGLLPLAFVTPRGTRLFDPRQIERIARDREQQGRRG